MMNTSVGYQTFSAAFFEKKSYLASQIHKHHVKWWLSRVGGRGGGEGNCYLNRIESHLARG